MSIEEIILYLRKQLLELRGENDRQAVAELLSTFKMLTKISFENGDKQLTAILVNLTDSARDLNMGKPLNGSVPTETEIREAAQVQLAVGQPTGSMMVKPKAPTSGYGIPSQPEPVSVSEALSPTESQPIKQIVTQEIESLELSFNHEADIQKRLRWVMDRNWYEYSQIRDGSTRQMKAYSTVYDTLYLFRTLAAHDPVWVGTYPIDIETEESDIDIICNPESLRPFLHQVKNAYGDQDEFHLAWKAIDRIPTVLARFTTNGFKIELFAQPRPTTSQHSFVHMLVEARLLAIGGPAAKAGIRRLKADGVKTEPAFVEYFQIEADDPYETLLEMAHLDNETLRKRINIPL